MSIIEKLRESLRQGGEKVSTVTEKLVEQGKKISEEGLDTTREVMAGLSEKASDFTAITRKKIELNTLKKDLNQEFLHLGKLTLAYHNNGDTVKGSEAIDIQIAKIYSVKKNIAEVEEEYDKLRSAHSDNFALTKLTEDLAAADAIIEQTKVIEKSSMAGKALKETRLPKEALISAVRRGNDLIIPDGNTKLEIGDFVTVIGKTEDVQKILKRLNPEIE